MSVFGQLVLIGISGKTLTKDEKKFIVENDISGVTLFDRNIESAEQVSDLCRELQELRYSTTSKAPLFIGIDMEGGRVARFKKPPFTVWPPLKKLGDLDNATASFQFANKMGRELHAVGINLDYAPCVDVFTNPKNTVIGDRSIGSDAEMVAKHVSALVRGYIKSDVIPCVKHFPGHGNTLLDSHEDLPEENVDMKRLDSIELVPFKRSFKARAEMVMTAHIRFPQIDPQWPVTLSEIFLKKILRDECRFRGLVITDDLDMKALTKHFDRELLPVRSLQAGADLLLYCNEPESPPAAIESLLSALAQGQLNKAEVEAKAQKVLQFKKDKIKNADPMSWGQAQNIVGLPEHRELSEGIAKGAVNEKMLSEPKA